MTCWNDPASCRGCQHCDSAGLIDAVSARRREVEDALILAEAAAAARRDIEAYERSVR